MPGILDKSKINKSEIAGDDDIAEGNARAIQKAYDAAIVLGEEIKAGGWLWHQDAKDFLARQEALCTKYDGDYFHHHAHQADHLKSMRSLTDDMRKWIDKMLQQP